MGNEQALWLTAVLVRCLLVAYGAWQDATLAVKYTDVDYRVFSDAAAAVWRGGSPYERATYRYSPLLAWLLLPNVHVPVFGKLLFCTCDLAAGYVIREVTRNKSMMWTAAWLLNPVVINVSTRGNCDSIICLLVLASGLLIVQRRLTLGAIVYGIAVHFRIFPIFFAPTIVLHLGLPLTKTNSFRAVKFGVLSGGTFLLLGAVCYAAYGWEFLYETYLYHLIRTDNRHNFSVYFYSLYLQYGQQAGFLTGLMAFLPAILVQLALAVAFHSALLFSMCLQTMAFVTFNKVCTAQYFVWFFALLPVALPGVRLSPKTCVILIASWLLTMLAWLLWAYLLEFQGRNTFLALWVSALLFFAANVVTIAVLADAHHAAAANGKVIRQD